MIPSDFGRLDKAMDSEMLRNLRLRMEKGEYALEFFDSRLGKMFIEALCEEQLAALDNIVEIDPTQEDALSKFMAIQRRLQVAGLARNFMAHAIDDGESATTEVEGHINAQSLDG